jgi:hypothetical protein
MIVRSQIKLCSLLTLLLATLFMFSPMHAQAAPEWTAYNDFAWKTGQLFTNITRITSPNGGSGYPSSGSLIKFADGSSTGVTLAITGGTYDPSQWGGDSVDPDNGDAYTFFNGKVSGEGSIHYNTSNTNPLVLTLTGLDPAKLYDLVFYADRGDYGWERGSLATLTGTSAFTNVSSAGTDNNGDPLFSGPTDNSTRLPPNNTNGWVARFTDINPGSDGQMVLTISFSGTDSQSRGRYASALMLASLGGPPPVTCDGDFDVDGDVDGTDLAERINGQTLDLTLFASRFGRDDCF